MKREGSDTMKHDAWPSADQRMLPRSSRLTRLAIVLVIGLTMFAGPSWPAHAAATLPSAPFSISPQSAEETEEANLSPDELTACLLGVWFHSMEEDSEEITVYRREGYPFPPARGRTGFEFIAAGYLVYHTFGPADEPEVWNGRWEVVGRYTVEISVNQSPGPDLRETLHIASCSADVLEISR